jgi:hypothetical protein
VCKGAVPCPYGRVGKEYISQILALIQTTTRGLLRWICLQMPLVCNIKQGVLLDPVPLHRDIGHAEAGIIRDVKGIELRRIAVLVHCAERTSQPDIQIKCQPAWRIIVSKTRAVISFTSIQFWPNGSRRGSKQSGRMHLLRRKTEWSLTIVHFWVSLARRY